MPTIEVLFPSSFPKNAEGLTGAKSTVATDFSDIDLHWPRAIRTRDLNDPQDYLAGSDTTRCEELINFLDSTAEIGWFGRGGFGTTRILRMLQKGLASINLDPGVCPKRWMGYSDITALFSFCKSHSLNVQCIHGPMVCAYPDQPNPEVLRNTLLGHVPAITVKKPQMDETFSASIFGGNLAVLASLCGTPWLATLGTSEVAFIEDIDESPYRTDRYLTQLHDSGFFRHCKRVFLGTFTGFEPEASVTHRVESRCRELGLTVIGHLPAGHSEPHTPIFFDREYRYDTNSQTLYSP